MAIDIGGNWVRGSSANGLYQDCRIDNYKAKKNTGMMSSNFGIVTIPRTFPLNVSSLAYNGASNNTTSYRYDCTESGVYYVMFRCMTENNSAAPDYYAIITRNGGLYPSLCYTSNVGAYHMEMHLACVMSMNSGDYVDIYAQYGHDFYGSNQRYTRLVVLRAS